MDFRSAADARREPRGFTLVEVLIVIVVIGVLSTITVFAVRGITDRGETSGCASDRKTLEQATDIYLGQNQVAAIPPTGAPADPDRFEQTLVDAGLLRQVSVMNDVVGDGSVVSVSPKC